MQDGKSIEDLFLKCSFANLVWLRWNEFSTGGKLQPTRNCDDTIPLEHLQGLSVSSEVIGCIAFFVTVWMIWLIRNSRVFENKSRDVQLVWGATKLMASQWVIVN